MDRTEVPLKIIHSPIVGPNTLGKLYQLQSILYNEEKSSFTDAIQGNQSRFDLQVVKTHT